MEQVRERERDGGDLRGSLYCFVIDGLCRLLSVISMKEKKKFDHHLWFFLLLFPLSVSFSVIFVF